jgi:RES domain
MPAEDSASRVSPAVSGWMWYQIFADSVKNNLRYVRSRDVNEFLKKVLNTCSDRKITIPKGTIFWRARRGHESKLVIDKYDDIQVCWDKDQPYSEKEMKPISNWQSESRANPRGIPYLYLATSRDTALAEVRPWIGSTISLGQFQVCRDLNVIDCSKHHSKEKTIGLLGDKTRSLEDGIWVAIDQAFATPVTRDDGGGEYIPTQIIAEMFKCEGFNGIIYKSLLSTDGLNLVLFDLNDADLANCVLYRAASISFDFQPLGSKTS